MKRLNKPENVRQLCKVEKVSGSYAKWGTRSGEEGSSVADGKRGTLPLQRQPAATERCCSTTTSPGGLLAPEAPRGGGESACRDRRSNRTLLMQILILLGPRGPCCRDRRDRRDRRSHRRTRRHRGARGPQSAAGRPVARRRPAAGRQCKRPSAGLGPRRALTSSNLGSGPTRQAPKRCPGEAAIRVPACRVLLTRDAPLGPTTRPAGPAKARSA
jgi:hypothetical protein